MKPVLSHPLRLSDLPRRKTTRFNLVPDAGQLEALADRMNVDAVKKVRLEVALTAGQGNDWLLEGHLGATVIQPCRVTTDPVTTRIEEDVRRLFTNDLPEPSGEEMEMPEDDGVEPLPTLLDLGDILEEVLILSIPAYPRAEGAEDLDLSAAPPGVEPLSDEAMKPFAGLAALKDKLEGGKDD